jgi:hypothetical protein
LSNPDILFRGIPRGPTRAYTARVISAVQPKLLIVPCTGSFSLAYVARMAGAGAIVCGDISLYSTAIGNAIMGTDWRLALKSDDEYAELAKPYLNADPISKAAAVLLVIRTLQYVRKQQKLYHEHRRRELLRNAPVYIEQLKGQIAEIAELLKGVVYKPQDMWVTMEEYCDGEGVINLINPPRYNSGYLRMFKGVDDVFDWDVPPAAQFMERDYVRLMDYLRHKPALSLMYYATDGEDPVQLEKWGEPWRSVFADRPGKIGHSSINWIIANRSLVDIEANRAKITVGEAKYPLFKGAISDTSVLHAQKVDKQTGDFYRDLFIHKLPGSVTEVYVGLFMDGMLMGIAGLHLADYRRGKTVRKNEKTLDQCVSITFAFTCPHDTYARLHKLTLMSISSSWFWEDVLKGDRTFELDGPPKHVKTTMLTAHVENKTARGILTLDTREKQKDGSYKLTYSAAVVERTRETTVAEWLKKYAEKMKA